MAIVKEGKIINIQEGVFVVEPTDDLTVEEANKIELKKYLEEYNILEKSE